MKFKMKQLYITKYFSLLFLLFLFATKLAVATDFYVSISGNDASGDGSHATPWLTISKAFSSVPANGGHVINIGAGTFASTSNKIHSGVTVNGAGENATIISASTSWVLDISGIKNVTIQNLKFDGTGQPTGGGLLKANNGSDYLKILNVNFSNGNGVALNVSYSNNVVVDKGYYKEAGGRGNSNGDIAVVAIGPVINGIFKHLTIEDTNAQAFRGWGTLQNVIITNNVFKGTLTSSWGNGSGGSLGLELWGVENVENVEIAYNYSRGAISLAAGSGHGNKSVRVHHNEITGNYGIEMTMDNITADHNYFHNCGYAFGDFGNGDTYTGWNIHHNVCYNTGFSIFMHICDALTNSKIYNNTIYNSYSTNGPSARFNYWGGGITNSEFANNIIVSTFSYPFDNGGQPTSNNLFRYTSPVGSDYVTGDPMFVDVKNGLAGFALQSGSPAINAGKIIPGITDNVTDGNPDIGAIEKGETWTVGPLSANAPGSIGLVNISSPKNGDIYSVSSIIAISADAICEKGIVKVEFYQGDTKLGEATTAPYSFKWSNAPKGTFTLKVVATDSEGKKFESNGVTITVSGITVKISKIDVFDNENSTANVTINTEAKVISGSIKKVEFYNGTVLLGEETSSPYKFIWNNVASGPYSFTVKVTDDQGISLESLAVTIIVKSTAELVKTSLIPVIDGVKDAIYSGAGNPIRIVTVGNVTGASDLTASWTGTYDDTNLYFFLNVTDDIITTSKSWYNGDGIEIMIDQNNSKPSGYGSNDFLYGFTWESTLVIEQAKKNIHGIQYKMVKTTNGYDLEALIPWATIGGKPSGEMIGLEIQVDDCDDNTTRHAAMNWNTDQTTAYQNPSLFGTVKLGKTTGIGDLFKNQFRVYPNPSNGIINIDFNSSASARYTVFNICGEVVKTGILNPNGKIDLSDRKGVFLLRIGDDQTSYIEKFIVN